MKSVGLKTLAVVLVMIMGMLVSGSQMTVKAAQNSSGLSELIEKTVESDKNILNKLSPLFQKAYDKIVALFKKAGTLSKDISRVVKMYNALDETSEEYPEKLQEFFEEYNKLGVVKRKVVDFCTGVLDAKDKLLANIRHIVLVDMYSEKQLMTGFEGKVDFASDNEAVATVDGSGLLKGVSVGTTKVEATNEAGEKETFRIFVKKPLLASKVTVKKGNEVTITVDKSYDITEVIAGSNKVSVNRDGYKLSVEGKKKGTAYIYVGTKEGKTVKYKVTVS